MATALLVPQHIFCPLRQEVRPSRPDGISEVRQLFNAAFLEYPQLLGDLARDPPANTSVNRAARKASGRTFSASKCR
jgi:hypothetical protein